MSADAMATTSDSVLGGRVTLRQPAEGYRVAIDPILLAASCPARAGEMVADLGCGIGTAALCMARRVTDATCVGVDLQADLIVLAEANAKANGLADRARFLAGDILDAGLPIYVARADHVIVNPPYLKRDSASVSESAIKALANVEGEADLRAWVNAAMRAAKPGGSVTFIHRADRLPELLSLFAPVSGSIAVLPLYPRDGEPARRVIVSGKAGQRGPARLLPGLVLHEANGDFTPAAQRILRDGAALPLII